MDTEFATASHENTTLAATTLEDFYDELEPIEQPEDGLADMLAALIDFLFSVPVGSDKTSSDQLRRRMESGLRRLAAITWIVRPSAIGEAGTSGRRLAESLGISRAGFSALAVQASDLLGGLRAGGMKAPETRERCRSSATGKPGKQGTRRPVSPIGDYFRDESFRADLEQTVSRAMLAFHQDRPWKAEERRVLVAMGFLGDNGEFTPKGLERAHRGKESAHPHPLSEVS
jgi:hypothetical protein